MESVAEAIEYKATNEQALMHIAYDLTTTGIGLHNGHVHACTVCMHA